MSARGWEGDRSLLTDGVLYVVSLGLLVWVLSIVFSDPDLDAADTSGARPLFGKMSNLTNEVRRRTDGSLVWNDLARGDSVYEKDVVFVGTDSEAMVALEDGSAIEIDENSLVVLRRPQKEGVAGAGPLTVHVLRGQVSGQSAAGEISILAGSSSLTLRHDSRARVQLRGDRSARIDVTNGGAKVQTADRGEVAMTAGQRREIDDRGTTRSASDLTLALAEPSPSQRLFYIDEPPPIRFRWDPVPDAGSYLFELAADPGFNRILLRETLQENKFEHRGLKEGVYYWRVKSPEPARISEERKLVLVVDSAPIPYLPGDGDVVYLPKGAELLLAWIDVPDVDQYVFELTRAKQVVVRKQVRWASHYHKEPLEEDTYCLRVRSDEPDRGNSPWSETACFRVITRPLPRAPRLFKPTVEEVPLEEAEEEKPRRGSWLWRVFGGVAHAAEAKTRAIVLRWEAIPGIQAYILEIAEDEEFGTIVVREQVPHNYYRWRTLTHQNYFWRVKSIDAEGREGEFSQPRMIGAVVKGPVLVAPEDGASLGFGSGPPRIPLKWKRSGLIARYVVQISEDAAFSKVIGGGEIRGRSSFEFLPRACGSYHWRVHGIDLNGRKTRVSERRAFRVAPLPPDSLKPAPDHGLVGSADTRVRLSWSPRPVDRYVVELSLDPRFRQNVVRATRKKPFHLARLPTLGIWHWRVRGLDPRSEWSRPSRLRVAPPVPEPIAPEDGATVEFRGAGGSCELSWRPIGSADAYRIEVRAEDQPEFPSHETQATSLRLENLAAGTYRWTVRAVHRSGVQSEPSSARRLTLVRLGLPAAPALSSPDDGVEIVVTRPEAVRLAWQDVERAAAYRVELSVSDRFAEILSHQRVADPLASIEVPANGEFFWRVRAVDETGAEGSWSAVRAFRYRIHKPEVDIVKPPPPPPEPPVLFVAPHVAFFYNLGEITTARVGAELDYRLPLWQRRIGLTLLVGYSTATSSVTDDSSGLSAESRVHIIPVELAASCRFPAGFVVPYVGVGASLHITSGRVSLPTHPALTSTGTEFGMVAIAGAEAEIGPGSIFLEARYAWTGESRGLVEINPGGLVVGAGYRIGIW